MTKLGECADQFVQRIDRLRAPEGANCGGPSDHRVNNMYRFEVDHMFLDMTREPGIELAKILIGHHETLSVLREYEQLTTHQLGEHLDHSRATINRHLATLREVDLITTERGTHELTAFGGIVLEELDAFCHPLTVSAHLPEFIEQLAACPIAFDVRMLDGAHTTKATSETPYRMHERYLRFWQDTACVKGLRSNAAVPPDIVDRIKPKLRAGVEVESIWTPRAATQFLDTYPDIKGVWMEEPNARMLITQEPIPVQLGLFDSRVACTVHDEATGYPRALVDTHHPAALTWANDLFAYYRAESEPLAAWSGTTEQLAGEDG